jgi:hypothetical protein
MPNWCCANVEISATEKEIKRLKKAIKDGNKDGAQKGLLNAMVPQPVFENDQEWYGWNIENWGTKWEVGHVQISDESKTSLSLTFDTAWGPAVQAFNTWAESDPDRDFTYKYWEPGMAFLGTAGPGYDDYISQNDDSLEYRRIAEEEWGEDFSWEDEQEEDEEDEDNEEDSELTVDFGDDQTNSDLAQALEDLKREFEALAVAEQDPEYRYLQQDIETLSKRVADYSSRKSGDNDE